MGNYQPTSRVLFNSVAAGVAGAVSANGNSAPIDLRWTTDVVLSVTVGTPTGTSPTLMVQLDVQDACGNWITGVVKLAANVTASGTYVAYGGLHANSSVVLTDTGRISWTIGGTTPNFPGAQISLVGR